MNKQEFLRQLERELAVVSEEERAAALQYFSMYFEDAGPEHEAEVIAELGSPQKIAADVRAASGGEAGKGWTPPPAGVYPAGGSAGYGVPPAPPAYAPKSNNTALKLILLILLFPFWVGALGVFIGLFVSFVVVLAVPLIIGFSFMAVGIASFLSGFVSLPFSIGGGVLAIGVACVIFALGLLAAWLGIWLLAKVVPAVLRGVGRILKAIFN